MGALSAGATAGIGAYGSGGTGLMSDANYSRGAASSLGEFGNRLKFDTMKDLGMMGEGPEIGQPLDFQLPEIDTTKRLTSEPINLQLQEGGVVPIPVRDGRDRQKGTINYYSLY